MSLFWKEYKEYIIIITLACFGVVLVWYGILPLQRDIKDQMNRSQEILTDSEIRDGLVANLSDLRDQKSVIEKKEDQLDRVISKNNIVDLVKDIEALAKETDNIITIDSVDKNTSAVAISKAKKDSASADDGNKTKQSLLESLPSEHNVMITMTLSGAYSDIVRFMQKFESMRYETDIISLSVSVQQPTISSGQPRMNVFALGDAIPADTKNTSIAPVPIDTALPIQAILNTVVYVNEN